MDQATSCLHSRYELHTQPQPWQITSTADAHHDQFYHRRVPPLEVESRTNNEFCTASLAMESRSDRELRAVHVTRGHRSGNER
jgi:hypothetical protein